MDSKTAAQLKELVGGINRLVLDTCRNLEDEVDKKHYEASNGPERITRDYSEQTLRFSSGKSEGPLSDGNYGPGYYNDEKITNSCGSKSPETPANIQDKVNQLFNKLDKLSCVVTGLSDQLEPVMRPKPAEEGKNTTGMVHEIQSPVAQQIESANEVLNFIIYRIIELSQRAEI